MKKFMFQKTINSKGEESPQLLLQQTTEFLLEYANTLLGCGATCVRIEKSINRMSESLQTKTDITILPRHILITGWDKERKNSYSSIGEVKRLGIDYRKNIRLSKLSWAVAENRISLKSAYCKMEKIAALPKSNKTLVLILTSFANASFCRLFGGDFIAMGIVFWATMCGFFAKQCLIEKGWDIRLITIISSLISSILGSGCYLFHIGNTPELAMGTCVLYLIPGITFINSISDLIAGHYLSAFCWFSQSVITTSCLSLGLCAGLVLMNINWFCI